MNPTKEQIEELAEWMHETCRAKNPGIYMRAWKDDGDDPAFKEEKRMMVRSVAAELLSNPPSVLRDSLTDVPVFVDRRTS